MKKAFYILLLVLMVGCGFSGIACGGDDALLKMVENKDFWSSYVWGKLEDSELYKTGSFELIQSFFENRYDFYEAEMKYDSMTAKFKIKSDNDSRIEMYFTYLPNAPLNDFDLLYQWCVNKYGNNYVLYENRKKPDARSTETMKEITWKLGNTAIQLSTSYSTEAGKAGTGANKGNKPVTRFISLVYKDLNAAKIKAPAAALRCKLDYDDKSMISSKINDLNLIIDENTNEVTNFDNTATTWKLKVKDKIYELDKKDSDNNKVHLSINKTNLKLGGRITIKDLPKPLKLKGSCKKIDSIWKKN